MHKYITGLLPVAATLAGVSATLIYTKSAAARMDVTVKDSTRFSKTNGWGFFNFGHHALPYETAAAEAPKSECAGCHMANVAKTDMTWVQFYPVLRGQN